jgi:hypothetical protein
LALDKTQFARRSEPRTDGMSSAEDGASIAQTRAGLDASIDSAAGTAVTVREGKSMFKSRPRKHGTFCIMFNNLNASSPSTLGHDCTQPPNTFLSSHVKWPFVFGLAVLAVQSYIAVAATPACERSTDFVEKQIVGSTTAFHAKMTEVVRDPAIATPGAIAHV